MKYECDIDECGGQLRAAVQQVCRCGVVFTQCAGLALGLAVAYVAALLAGSWFWGGIFALGGALCFFIILVITNMLVCRALSRTDDLAAADVEPGSTAYVVNNLGAVAIPALACWLVSLALALATVILIKIGTLGSVGGVIFRLLTIPAVLLAVGSVYAYLLGMFLPAQIVAITPPDKPYTAFGQFKDVIFGRCGRVICLQSISTVGTILLALPAVIMLYLGWRFIGALYVTVGGPMDTGASLVFMRFSQCVLAAGALAAPIAFFNAAGLSLLKTCADVEPEPAPEPIPPEAEIEEAAQEQAEDDEEPQEEE
jgi:hypothetical protein